MSKDKHSKKFQYEILNRCSVDNIDGCVRNKKWVKVKKMKMVGTLLQKGIKNKRSSCYGRNYMILLKKNGLQIATSIQDFTLEINSARTV